MPTHNASNPLATVSLYDARPFFEKALVFGVQHGILDQPKLDAICTDAPKGMVQIARYLGNEFLRPELEKAKDRMVNLVSLYLEQSSGGDLRLAAESLRDHSFLSRSKGGSDMLKSLIAMPQNSHFGMNERSGFTDEHIPLLAKWTLRSLPDYQVELAKREQVAQVIDAAIWLADALGMEASELEEAGKDAEAVIRTALLIFATGRTEMPDWIAFEKMVLALRKKYGAVKADGKSKGKVAGSASPLTFTIALPKNLPAQHQAVVEAVRQSMLADLPKILDAALPARKLFDQTPAFMGRYFWVEDGLSEVDHHDRSVSAAWNKATGEHSDDGSLLTLFLCVAAEAAPKTLLTEKGAAALIRKIRKSGFKPDLASHYIQEHAPAQHQDGYARLWLDFVEEAQATLQSDFDYELKDALALLRRECNVK
ncbi:MAG: hypothetical protein HHJ17_06135 [Rhodoferax sp.]|uniref:hypothetical protein n=1 Tax=Rhodoferax sp. TaxID=50421 RepID=UPI0017BA6E01|nr:hypothetical protein [Rhodoferax sp.]NMM13104.1 hypothetical protein [Rhodoferax sp.]NMM19382.1 hypothetical protein [Rhodoferax sp.]